jgi:hypothetical protein
MGHRAVNMNAPAAIMIMNAPPDHDNARITGV